MKGNALALAIGIALPPAALLAQGLDPALLTKPSVDAWPTHHGDYSARRFSTLKQIDSHNVRSLTLAWIYRANTSDGGAVIGGEGPEAPPAGGGMAAFGGLTLKSTPLLVNGVLYFSAPDHVWAVDARTGRERWHYFWRTRGGIHIGNRGVGIYGQWLYFLTPDNYFVSLDAATGKERWHTEIASIKREYFSSAAPIIIRNHVILGVGGDSLDVPGYLESRDPETGEVQWRWYSTPRAGEPGAETWPDEYSAAHGGGMPWVPGSYDPELNLYYFGTGNANPVLAGQSRAGDNLWTCSIVAINPDTGKMAWYYQATRHDTHDWDAAQVPILIDGVIEGKPRKLIAQANRNGHFFVLDRTNGKSVSSTEYIKTNWMLDYDPKGQPIQNPEKRPQIAGALVTPNQGGATNWYPPSFSPQTGLFYVNATRAFSVWYIYDASDNPMGWGGTDRGGYTEQPKLTALDYRTGKIKWSVPRFGGNSGLLTTAGNVLFNSAAGGLGAYNATTGEALWNARVGNAVTNGPITYELDGLQYVIAGAGSRLVAFVLNQ